MNLSTEDLARTYNNKIKIEIPNYKDLDTIKTINVKMLVGKNREEVAHLDEDTTRFLVNYAKENFLTIEDALEQLVIKKLREDFLTELAKHPIKTIKAVRKYKKENLWEKGK